MWKSFPRYDVAIQWPELVMSMYGCANGLTLTLDSVTKRLFRRRAYNCIFSDNCLLRVCSAYRRFSGGFSQNYLLLLFVISQSFSLYITLCKVNGNYQQGIKSYSFMPSILVQNFSINLTHVDMHMHTLWIAFDELFYQQLLRNYT